MVERVRRQTHPLRHNTLKFEFICFDAPVCLAGDLLARERHVDLGKTEWRSKRRAAVPLRPIAEARPDGQAIPCAFSVWIQKSGDGGDEGIRTLETVSRLLP